MTSTSITITFETSNPKTRLEFQTDIAMSMIKRFGESDYCSVSISNSEVDDDEVVNDLE